MSTFPDGIWELPDGISFPVKVTPGARKDEVRGQHDGALRVRVTAAPEKGKANKAVCALVAKALSVPKSAVSVIAGETASEKRLAVRGLNRTSLLDTLTPLLEAME